MAEFKIIEGCTADEIVEYIRIKTPIAYMTIKLVEYKRSPQQVVRHITEKILLIISDEEIHKRISKAINEYEEKIMSSIFDIQMRF